MHDERFGVFSLPGSFLQVDQFGPLTGPKCDGDSARPLVQFGPMDWTKMDQPDRPDHSGPENAKAPDQTGPFLPAGPIWSSGDQTGPREAGSEEHVIS